MKHPATSLLSGAVVVAALLIPHAAIAQVRRPPAPRPSGPSVVVRPYLLFAEQRFTSAQTFDAAFGSTFAPFVGGGVEFDFRNSAFLDVSASWARKSGTRKFAFNGQVFDLGAPLQMNEVPIEAAIGYRIKVRQMPRITPYVAVGGGLYLYRESSNDPADLFSTARPGGFGRLGVDVRVSPRVTLSGDIQVSVVPDVLGSGGLSAIYGENDLGGASARVRLIFGR